MMRSQAAMEYIRNRMKKDLPGALYYHNVPHVLDVVEAAERIGHAEGITAHEMELLLVAAWYHDSGFLFGPDNHEKMGCEIVREHLPAMGFSQSEIDIICGLIMATRVPQSPCNHLEKIMCDADLDYLGRDDFYTIGNNIYREFLQRKLVANETEWNQMQVQFLESHNYFTETAIRQRKAAKEKHLGEIRKLLAHSGQAGS
jgi:predicted metal-dependent HD superfamily phosphohydrolase